MISYAQNFEDAVLARTFADRETGFYIDLGAGDPEFHSVTKHFYEAGWSGVNVEPLEARFTRLEQQRTRDVNLRVAVDDVEGTRVLNALSFDELSSFDDYAVELAKRHNFEVRSEKVETLTLRTICERHAADRPIQFLKIDVEGWERQAIASGDWERFRPEVVLIEATKAFSQDPNHELWEDLLLQHRYVFCYFDGLNRFYVAAEHEALARKIAGPPDFLLHGVRLASEVEYERRVDEMTRGAALRDDELSERTAHLGALQQELTALRQDRDVLVRERESLRLEVEASRQELFESARVSAHWARERQTLETRVHAEVAAREALAERVQAEVKAREALYVQMQAEVRSREALMQHVEAERALVRSLQERLQRGADLPTEMEARLSGGQGGAPGWRRAISAIRRRVRRRS